MNGSQQFVGTIGAGLVVANLVATNQWPTIQAGAFSSSASTADSAAAHLALRNVALELAFVAGATLLAGSNGQLAGAMLAMMIALAIVFAMKYPTLKAGKK